MNYTVVGYWCVGLLCCMTLAACQSGSVSRVGQQICQTDQDAGFTQNIVNIKDSDNRQMKVWLGVPERSGARPFLVFSHGAFSTPERYQVLLEPFVRAGYIVAAPWHIDSEDIVKTTPLTPAQNWLDRRRDITTLLQLPGLLEPYLNPYHIQINRDEIGLFGHSYGAFTVQVFAGAYAVDPTDGLKKTELNSSVKAVLAYSPPGPIRPFIEDNAWRKMTVPSMVVSGSADVLPGFIDDWTLHLKAFETAPTGNNWAFVGKGVDHYFGKRFGRLDSPDPNQAEAFSASLQLGIAFMNSFVRDNQAEFSCLKKSKNTVEKNSPFYLKHR